MSSDQDVTSEGAPETPVAERSLSFEFKGDAREYFRIWIVNLCLTIVTLGVFSAWAKVRKKRYFYSHTVLDGSPFQYLGKPIPILKGRLLAVVLVVTWYAVLHLRPDFAWLLWIAFLILVPWIAVRSAAFNARYSAFRNMTFRFRGSYSGFFSALIGWALLTAVSCSLAYPWLRAKFSGYMISRTSFGGVPGAFRGRGGQFVSAYLISGLGLIAVVTTAGIVLGTFRSHAMDLRAVQRFTYVTYVAYFFSFLYLKAHVTNLIWGKSELGGLRFESTLAFRELIWIYLSNSVAILGTAGILVPWAAVRVAKYRAAHFAVWATTPLEEFEGSDRSTVRAAGAEVGELFDLDIAL